MAFLGLTSITSISKIFISCFLLHCQKYDVFYALPFFQKLQKSRIMSQNFSNCSNFNICYDFQLIWLMMMLLFWLRCLMHASGFMFSTCLWKSTCLRRCKITVLTWFVVLSSTSCLYVWGIQKHFDNTCWGCVLADADISVIPKYRPSWYIGLSLYKTAYLSILQILAKKHMPQHCCPELVRSEICNAMIHFRSILTTGLMQANALFCRGYYAIASMFMFMVQPLSKMLNFNDSLLTAAILLSRVAESFD